MLIVAKIALRNVIASKKRSFLIGLVIFLSTFILLISDAMMNGVERQILKGYDNLQASDVVVMWDSLKKVGNDDTTRLLFLTNNSFDPKKDAENKRATDKLNSYLDEHKSEVKAYYPLVRRNASLVNGNKKDSQFSIFGLTEANRKFLLESRTIELSQGELIYDDSNALAISRAKADEYDLDLGDKVEIAGLSIDGKAVARQFVIKGIYANGAGWDNYYGFIAESAARDLFQYKPGTFDIAKIYLDDAERADDFAKDLDSVLTAQSDVLRAESSSEASAMFPMMAQNLKAVFNLFIFALLFIIAIGLRATINMNLFERMKEFGTIRAIGYSRAQSFAIIFFEAFFLSLSMLCLALVSAFVLVQIFSEVGVYLGDGPLSYFGGESIYPSMRVLDVLFALVIIALFALLSTFNPGLKLLYQNITDIMAKRQKRVFLPAAIWRGWFPKATAPPSKDKMPLNR